MWHVVAAIEIVVDVYLPVAIQVIHTAIEVPQLLVQLQRRRQVWYSAEKIAQGNTPPIQVYKNKVFPDVHPNRHKSIRRTIEIAYAVKFHDAFERAVDPVGPAVVRASELLRATRGFGHDRRGMVPADIVESAQLLVVAAY